MSEDLRTALVAFDGKAISLLSEAAAAHAHAPDYVDQLLMLITDPEPHIGEGASWLIKAHLEAGHRLTDVQSGALLDGLDADLAWPTALHILQSVQYLDGGEAADVRRLAAIEVYTRHERAFVRAWALDAYVRLAAPHPDQKKQIARLLEQGHADPAASVRARARRLSQDRQS